MTTAFTVIRAGIHATVQDGGRAGYRALGVPVCGALDRTALHLVNALVGNAQDAATIEMLYSGMTIEVTGGGAARIAVACTDAVIERSGEPSTLLAWHSAVLRSGERLRISAPRHTAAAYLAVEGGYAITPVLGSTATYVQGNLGGHCGRPLRAGDVLNLVQQDNLARPERRYATPPQLAQPTMLRIMPGPQLDHFTEAALDRLVSAPYRIAPASSRSGLRLEGPVIEHAAGHDLLSEGVATGSVQVPGSGQPVILIADHPTVGGYPKIATLISADWPAAGRLRIGASFRFALCEDSAAAAARRAQREWTANQVATIETIAA